MSVTSNEADDELEWGINTRQPIRQQKDDPTKRHSVELPSTEKIASTSIAIIYIGLLLCNLCRCTYKTKVTITSSDLDNRSTQTCSEGGVNEQTTNQIAEKS